MRESLSPTRRVRRKRVKIALGLAVLGLLLAFVPEDLGRKTSITLARLRGYDGCLCTDCGREFGFLGYSYRWTCGTGRAGSPTSGQALAVLNWAVSLVMLLTAIEPGPARSRFGPGCCEGCGYDLTGLPAGSRCPECGAMADRGRA